MWPVNGVMQIESEKEPDKEQTMTENAPGAAPDRMSGKAVPLPAGSCAHMSDLHEMEIRTNGCEECLKTGDSWFHLRQCMVCGKVGCCDQSKNRHATRHFHETGHPVIRSLEPGDNWYYCYLDRVIATSQPTEERGES